MAYCTLTDLQAAADDAELIEYTDDADEGAIDTDVTDWAITGAGAVIDSYLAKKHAVPLDPVPDMVKDLAVDIALYKITFRRGSGPDPRRTKYEDAIKFLKDVAAGNAVIPGAAAAGTGFAGADAAKITSDPRIFTREKMSGY